MPQVEVDEVLGFMCHKGAEISSYDAMPSWAFPLIELGDLCQKGLSGDMR